MKTLSFSKLLVFGLLLSVAAVGCKHRQPQVTPLNKGGIGGDNGGPGGLGGPGAPGTGGTFAPGGGPGVSSAPASVVTPQGGFPQGPGHTGWIDNADQFKSDTAYFDFDSAVVRASEKSKVTTVADYLKANAATAVRVEGHCDERGTEEYNRSLGERRALAIREALIGAGVDSTRVDTLSYGKDRPAEPGHDEEAWRKNRRGEFILLTPPK